MSYEKLRPGPGQGAVEVAEHQRARIQLALIEAAAANGYRAIKVRGLARRASVSSRTFYQHYSGKEECFLRTHEAVFRRLVRRILVAQARADDWRDRVRRTVAAVMQSIERDPAAARLMLVEVYAAGPVAQEQLRRAERTLEARVAQSLDGMPGEIVMPPLVVKGITAGLLCVARTRILDERARELPSLSDRLAEWTLSLCDQAVTDIGDLDHRYEWGESAAEYPPLLTDMRDRLVSVGSKAAIFDAVGKLVAAEGYEALSSRAICAAADERPRTFRASFTDVEDCFLQAVATRTQEALWDVDDARVGAPTWTAAIHRSVTSICRRVATDPTFAALCFAKTLPPGLAGVRSRALLLDKIGEHLLEGVLPAQTDDVAVEASIGAVWEVLHQLVAAGRAGDARRSTAVLAYLVAAPIVGAKSARDKIRREIENATAQKLPSAPLDAILVDGHGQHGLSTSI